jgi:exodeoxyribonuclease VII small subunit
MNASNKKLNYESAIAELEQIVSTMESGQLPLESALAHYKRGAELIKQCQLSLAAAEQQINLLNDQGQLTPYDVE